MLDDKYEIVEGSELPEEKNPDGKTFLGYMDTGGGILKTVRISFDNMTPLFGVSQEKGQDITLVPSQKAWTDDTILRDKTIMNITQRNGENVYPSRTEARNAIPAGIRGVGQILTYLSGAEFRSTNFTKDNGKTVQSSNGNISTSAPENVCITIHLPDGYDIVNLRIVTTIGDAGGAFFDAGGNYVSGFKFLSSQATAGERKNIAIPANAKVLKTTYRKDDSLGSLPPFGYVLFFNSKDNDKQYIVEHFIGDDISQWQDDTKWEDIKLSDAGKYLTGNRGNVNNISNGNGKVILDNIEKLVYLTKGKPQPYEKDISGTVKSTAQGGLSLHTQTGIFTTASNAHTFIFMYRLKKNTRYRMSGFKNTWKDIPYFFLYPENNGGLPSVAATKSYGYTDLQNGVIEFTTTGNDFTLGMYYKYAGGGYAAFINDTLSVIEFGEEPAFLGLADEEGNLLPVGGDNDMSNPLQTPTLVNSSFPVTPADVVALNRDKIFKVTASGRYSNLGASQIKVYKNGKYAGLRSIEISNNELKENDIYFSYKQASGELAKIAVAKQKNDILDVTKTNVNAAWCWFGSPNFLYRDGKTFIGIVDGSNGRASVVQYNHDTKEVTKVTLSTVSQKDDHNQPSFIHLSDGRILTTYCEHSTTALFRYRISKNVNDASQWEAEQTVTIAAQCTYSHLFKLADGTIINIYRSRVGNTLWAYRKFNETTLTFGDETIFLTVANSGYMIPAQDDLNKNIIHILCTNYHPAGATATRKVNVYYFKFDVTTSKAYKSDNTLIGNLPMHATDVYNPDTEVLDVISAGDTATKNQWIEDIVVRYGKARVLFNIYPNSAAVDASVKHLMYSEVDDSGKWTEPVMICRPLDGYVENRDDVTEKYYSAAATFDNTDLNLIWCPIQVNGVMEIFKIDIANGFEFKQCTYDSPNNQWRPIVTGATDGNKIIAWLDAYNYLFYQNQWNMNLVIASEKPITGNSNNNIILLTRDEYDKLMVKDPGVFYFIKNQ